MNGKRLLTVLLATALFGSAQARPRMYSRVLEVLCGAIGLSLPDSLPPLLSDTETWSCGGRSLHVRTNTLGDVCHLGLPLFPTAYSDTAALRPMLDFVERKALEQTVERMPEEMSNRIRREKIETVGGSLKRLLEVTPQTSFSVDEVEGKGYRITWALPDGDFSLMMRLSYHMLASVDAVELEDIVERDLPRMSSESDVRLADSLVALAQRPEASRGEGVAIVNQGNYVNDLIRSDIYLMDDSLGNLTLVSDRERSMQWIRNTLLTGLFSRPLAVDMRLDRYGFEQTSLAVTLQQFTAYCRAERCRLFIGIKSHQNRLVKATVFAVNTPLAYCHMFSVEFDEAILDGDESVPLRGTLYCYIPLQNMGYRFMNVKKNDR